MKLGFDDFDYHVKQKDIILFNNRLRDDNLDDLIRVIEHNTVLKRLQLGYNNLTLDNGKLLADAIAKKTTLKELLLHNNNISDEGIKHLAAALKENDNDTLQTIDLDGNNIGDEGARCLADMLTVNKTLLRITLDNNNIGDKGAESIATSLTINTGIREMWLDGNDITDAGAGKLVEALEGNHSIKTLTLYSTGISYNNISKGMMDRIKAILQDPKRKTLIANNKENEQETKGENQIKSLPNKQPAEDTSSRQKKKQKKDDELTKIVKALEEEYNRLMEELADAQKKVVSARQVKDQLNSALKEKEDALKLVASMKADITRKKEEIEKKEQEVKSRDTDIANKDQQLKSAKVEVKKVKSLEEENKRLQNELVDAQKKVAESDIDIANKNKQLESIKRILNPATDDDGEPASKRTRTEDTPNKPKVKSVQLDYEHTHCSICASKFSADLDSKDENVRKHLPVLSASSKSCDHCFCYGCILQQQAAIAEKKQAPKWIACMECRTKTAFQPSEPKYHRLLIDILKKAKWTDMAEVKEEPDE